MGRIGERFAALREGGERGLVPFVTGGDPDLATSEAVVRAVAAAGADAVEIGVPFSDPLAEGPTIQRSSERALRAGSSLRRVLGLVKSLRADVDVPLVLMGYANNFLCMGEHGFAEAARDVGVDGLIAVDLPPEEGTLLATELERVGIDRILLAAPTTSPGRLAMLVRETRGFLYYVSLTGVTGARPELARGIEAGVRAAQALGEVPVCVGFGISTPEQARQVAAYADGVVVGSAAGGPDAAADAAAHFVAELKAALRGAGPG
jgi:tryptophan synthase alpha chain